MAKNSHFKYIRKGRPKINAEYVFNNKKYMSIIFLIHNCEHFKRQPQFVHLGYALVEKFNTKNHAFKVLKTFFDIKSISLDNETMVDNLQYYAVVTWDSEYRGIKKVKEYRDIISLTIDYVKTFLELKYDREFTENKIDFMRLKDNVYDSYDKNKEFKKPFKNKDDLHKYMNYLRKIGLITTDDKKRNASYGLTEKCKVYLYRLHIEHLKYFMIQKIKTSPYPQIEKNYFNFINLFK